MNKFKETLHFPQEIILKIRFFIQTVMPKITKRKNNM